MDNFNITVKVSHNQVDIGAERKLKTQCNSGTAYNSRALSEL